MFTFLGTRRGLFWGTTASGSYISWEGEVSAVVIAGGVARSCCVRRCIWSTRHEGSRLGRSDKAVEAWIGAQNPPPV